MVNSGNECNASCSHCYLPYQGKRDPKKTVELVGRLQEQGHDVSVAGSETLTDLDYLEAYQKASQEYILTNGILLNKHPEIYDKLLEHGIEEITVSLHFGIEKSLGSVPEKIAAKVIEEAKKKGIQAGIATVITPKNYRNVEFMCHSSYILGADSITFLKYVKSGRARKERKRVITEQEKKEFFKSVVNVRKELDIEDLEIVLGGNFGPRKGSKGEKLARKNKYCPAGKSFFAVDPNDVVYGCPFLMEFPIGRLTSEGIKVEKELCNGKRDRCLTDYLL